MLETLLAGSSDAQAALTGVHDQVCFSSLLRIASILTMEGKQPSEPQSCEALPANPDAQSIGLASEDPDDEQPHQCLALARAAIADFKKRFNSSHLDTVVYLRRDVANSEREAQCLQYTSVSNLAESLLIRHAFGGRSEDLDEAIETFGEASRIPAKVKNYVSHL